MIKAQQNSKKRGTGKCKAKGGRNRRHAPPERPWEMSFITLNMCSVSELEMSCTETLSRSCVPSCMKETGALCTEMSNMCEVDAAPWLRVADLL